MAYRGMSVQEAARQLRVLKKSLEEADRRDVKPMREELEQLHHIGCVLSSAGYRVFPVCWLEITPESERYPHAFQVLAQVNWLIDYLDDNLTAPPPRSKDVIKDGMSPEEVLPHLRALKMSFEEADRRQLLPGLKELDNFRFMVVSLQVAGHESIVSLPRSEDPRSQYHPKAFQVLIQVQSLIDSLEKNQSNSPDEETKRVQKITKCVQNESQLLKEDRFTEYRKAILKLCRENQDPKLRRTIAETVEREEKMCASFDAAKRAIKLVDEDLSQSPGKNASKKVLLDTLKKHRISEGTNRQRFGLALIMLKYLGQYEYEAPKYPGNAPPPNTQQ